MAALIREELFKFLKFGTKMSLACSWCVCVCVLDIFSSGSSQIFKQKCDFFFFSEVQGDV